MDAGNRILAAAEEIRQMKLSPEQIEAAERVSELDAGEGMVYQNLQARAHAAGILTLEEATTIYGALGGEAAHWSDEADFALRVVVTKTLAELAPLAMAGQI